MVANCLKLFVHANTISCLALLAGCAILRDLHAEQLVRREMQLAESERSPRQSATAKLSEVSQHSKYVPAWARQAVFYQIFPERFENGDATNDPTRESLEIPERVPKSWSVTPWGQDWYRRQAWEIEMGNDFFRHGLYHRRYGGDLQGILNRLDYLEDLGVTCIYLNPIFYARSLHKYDGNSFHHVDPYFGPDPKGDLEIIDTETLDPTTWQMTAADELFVELISEAHRREMRIIIDGVFNHTGRDFPAYLDLQKRQQESIYKDWYIVQSFDDPTTSKNEFRYESWWGNKSLPVFADNAEGDDLHAGPKRYVLAATRRWMDPDGDGDPSDGIDGWRLDVANEVPLLFWKQWNDYARTINPQCYTVAEHWEDAGEFLVEGGFSASMNYFGFAYPVKGFFVDGVLKSSEFLRQLKTRRARYDVPRQYVLQNLIDSHDTQRVASLVVNASGGEYERADWCDYDSIGGRDPNYKIRKPTADERQVQRMITLFQMVYLGAPIIYYGTETGMWGGDDPCDRMPMVWQDKRYELQASDPWLREREPDAVQFDQELHQFYRAACQLRRNLASLQSGEVDTLAHDDAQQSFAIRRWKDQQSVYAIFNRGLEPFSCNIEISGGNLPVVLMTATGADDQIDVKADGEDVVITVPAREAAILLQE